jgi:hypothetical protein
VPLPTPKPNPASHKTNKITIIVHNIVFKPSFIEPISRHSGNEQKARREKQAKNAYTSNPN